MISTSEELLQSSEILPVVLSAATDDESTPNLTLAYGSFFGGQEAENSVVNFQTSPTISTNQPDLFGVFFDVVQGSLNPGNTLTVNLDIRNGGSVASGGFNVSFYLSTNNIISTSDFLLSTGGVSGGLAGLTTGSFTTNLTLPGVNNPFWNGNGTYYIGMIIDSGGSVLESNENNNSNVGLSLDYDNVVVSVDDAYEQNDTIATAYNFSNQEQTWLSNIAGLGRQADQDWYRINVDQGYENLVVDLQFNHALGDLNLGVYDAAGNLVTSSTSTTNNEFINTILPGSGTYYLRVDGATGNTFNTYDLRWDDVLVDDAYEQNDTITTAYNFSNQEQTWLSNIAGFGRQADQDWYRINVDQGYENLVVDLQFNHALGDLDLGVYDAAGNLVASSTSSTDNESINTLLPGSGTYYLLVDGYPGDTFNYYDLRWDDRLYLVGTEYNDTLSGTPNPDTIIGLRGDDDIFGGGGNDFLQGDRGDDNIFGEAGNDNIQGNRGDDYLFGGTGNDNLDGDRGDDILVGVDPNSTNPGFGEIDILTSGFGADVFVLGDENQAYYNDLGIGDYALITDFDFSLDVIELQGSASNYQLGTVSPSLPSGIGIFLQTPAQNELIAIVQGAASLNLNADYFSYVS